MQTLGYGTIVVCVVAMCRCVGDSSGSAVVWITSKDRPRVESVGIENILRTYVYSDKRFIK